MEGPTAERGEKLQEKVLYVTCEQLCFRIAKKQLEEAYFSMLSMQQNLATSLLLSLLRTHMFWLCSKIRCRMYQKCGTKARTRFLDITKLSNALRRSVCNALIGMHAFTGCDTISAFAGRGKMTALKQMTSDKAYQEAFTELGRSWEYTFCTAEELSEKLQEITCCMYLPSTRTAEVNKLRYQTFCARRAEVDSSQLPPCEDCLSMHILRANYQAAIGRRCLEPSPFVPSPTRLWLDN